ncbi:hypothetical protein A2U01_0096729, partial [Trifolium medium]|nr:hypothetical protein [Trifolium medium]
DVLVRVGGRWGGVGVAASVEGVGGGDVGGVSDLTSSSLLAGSVFRYMAMAA